MLYNFLKWEECSTSLCPLTDMSFSKVGIKFQVKFDLWKLKSSSARDTLSTVTWLCQPKKQMAAKEVRLHLTLLFTLGTFWKYICCKIDYWACCYQGKIPSQSKELTHLDSPKCCQLCNHLLYTHCLAISTKPNQFCISLINTSAVKEPP